MQNHEDSSFLQGVEGRLDSLAGAGKKKIDEDADQSKVISEIEKQFNSVFGDNSKEVKSEAQEKDTPSVEEIILKAEQADIRSLNQDRAGMPPSSSALYPPLKDLKSIVLSFEWEISIEMLDKFDDEINKLHSQNEGDSTILGFLQILGFLGLYIRVKGPDSHRSSVVLLLSVFDNLEDVIMSAGMTSENKRAILLEDIKNYREWAVHAEEEIDLLDIKSEKQKLDLFLSSLAGERIPQSAAKGPIPGTYIPVVLQSNRKPEAKVPDFEEPKEKRDEPVLEKSPVDDMSGIGINLAKLQEERDESNRFEIDDEPEKKPSSYNIPTMAETMPDKAADKYTEKQPHLNVMQHKGETISKIDDFEKADVYERNEETVQFGKEDEDVAGNKITWIALAIVIMIISALAGAGIWFFPEKKNQALRFLVLNVPYADRVITVEKAPKQNPDSLKVEFIDVRQRIIRNSALGRNIRVVEGIVKNNTSANLSKVKVMGELYNSEGILLLTSRISLAGNVLADNKLENIDEDKIFSALSIAPASNLSDAVIPPMGQAPFMIVFTREPERVFKLIVLPVLD